LGRNEPLKDMSKKIATQVAAAMGGKQAGNVRSIGGKR
jgi:hypothetical protein